MNGTKMSLKRYGNDIVYFDYQEIIVDEDYLAVHNDLIVNLDYLYIPGLNMLEVYYNGQFLAVGGGYEEIDTSTIRLDIRDSEGKPIPCFLLGDEIIIKIWRNNYATDLGLSLYAEKLLALEQEISRARAGHPGLDGRLNGIEDNLKKVIVFVLPGKRIKLGVQNVEIRFPFRGTIVDAYASCCVPGIGRTVIQIEKISQDDYDNTSLEPVGWENIFLEDLVLEAGEKSTKTSATPYSFKNISVNPNDHFRVNIAEVGSSIEDIVVEVTISVN